MEGKTIHTFKLNDHEELHIAIGEFKGKNFLDQRVYFKPEGEDRFVPSKRGLRFNPEFCTHLKEGFQKVEEAMKK